MTGCLNLSQTAARTFRHGAVSTSSGNKLKNQNVKPFRLYVVLQVYELRF